MGLFDQLRDVLPPVSAFQQSPMPSVVRSRLNSGDSFAFHTDPAKNRTAPQMTSPNGRAWFVMQSDGNAVLSQPDGKILWASKTRGGRSLVMQRDGNLVILAGNGAPLWASGTNRSGDPVQAWGGNLPRLVLQDDGNLVIISGTTPIWSTSSNGFVNRQDEGGWLENAIKTAGRAVESGLHAVSDVSSSIGDTLGKVPFVGPGLKGLYGYTYGAMIDSADAVVSGVRLDKVASRHFESQVKNVKAVAPYVQTVIGFVPGIGPGISGAISGGLALASGQTIDQALLDAAVGALPGGALAQAVAKVGIAAAQGKRIDEIAINALPISQGAKDAVIAGTHVLEDVAAGRRVDTALLNEANRQVDKLPPAAKTAFQVGIALGQGKKLQEAAAAAVPQLIALGGPLAKAGLDAAQKSPLIAQARNLVDAQARHGFDLGTGLMKHASTLAEITNVRNALANGPKKAFDMAVALHTAQVVRKAPSVKAPPLAQAAHYMMLGMMGAPTTIKTSVARTLVSHPVAREGASSALLLVTAARAAAAQRAIDQHKSLWLRFKEFFGLAPRTVLAGTTPVQQFHAATNVLRKVPGSAAAPR